VTFWETKTFKTLQQAWYRRLKAEGFQDAEEFIAGELVLKQSAANCYRGADQTMRVSKEAYYMFVSQQVEQTIFESDVDQLILRMHAEGKKKKHICEQLASIGKRRCRNTVTFRIRIYEMRWGIRAYTPKQLNRKAS
jgi:hypothetical protein